MRSIVLYLHMHQPYRVKHYSIFAVGHDHDYWTDKDWYAGTNNERIFKKVAEKSYRPMLKRLKKCIETFPGFKFSLSITGVFLEQAEEWAPDIIETLQELVKTGRVEILSETYYHSLSFFYDKSEFEAEVVKHREKIRELFGVETKVYRNTEFSYNNDLAKWADGFGFQGILAEGWDKILENRSPNHVYRPDGCQNIKLLLKNYQLSDDIAFRFSDKNWPDWPLTVEKYIRWLERSAINGPLINLFMDFETFGEHQWKDTGIFDFMNQLISDWLTEYENKFVTVSEAAKLEAPQDGISMPETITWADTERDLSAWNSNSMQKSAMEELYSLREKILSTQDNRLISDWRHLTTSDHPYAMCTKYWHDGDVHAYFSAYASPYEAFMYFMNVLRDLEFRIGKA